MSVTPSSNSELAKINNAAICIQKAYRKHVLTRQWNERFSELNTLVNENKDPNDEDWNCSTCLYGVIPDQDEEAPKRTFPELKKIVKTACVTVKAGNKKVSHPHFFHEFCARMSYDNNNDAGCPLCKTPLVFAKIFTPIFPGLPNNLLSYDEITQLINSNEVDFSDNPNGDTILLRAIRFDNLDYVKAILESNQVDINAPNQNGSTPLHMAAGNGHTGSVELLISGNANIEALNQDRETPLHLAAGNGHTGSVELLINGNANPGALNHEGDTPLQLADCNGHTGSVELLIKLSSLLAIRPC